MSEFLRSKALNQKFLGGIALVVMLVFVILLLAQSTQSSTSQLKPFRPTATANSLLINNQPILVTFDQLNEDPFNFLNKRIQVTGDFQLLAPPSCRLYNGPILRWSLIANDLQLDIQGYEPIARLVPTGVSLTIEGTWRLYQGPLGCGKKPATGNAWYLEISQIVQPNPLPLTDGTLVNSIIATPLTATVTTPEERITGFNETPVLTTVTVTTPTATGTATTTATPTGTATASTTPSPTITPSPGPGTTLPTRTVTPTPSSTPTATPTATPGPSPTPQPTVPAPPTSTIPSGGGYPGNGGGSYP